jgi:bacteriophage HK97-gp10 putative tail-component
VSLTLKFDGLEEFKADLRRLPSHLADRAADIIENAAEEAKSSIYQAYPRRTGHLREGLSVEHSRSAFGAVSIVRNKAKHAFIFEVGTETRKTSLGAVKGRMPPGHVFVRITMQRRRRMYQEIADMMRSEGLEVHGDVAA